MKKYGRPLSVVTDGLRAYPAAMKEVGIADRQEVGRRLNNRAENSHQTAAVQNTFNVQRHLTSRRMLRVFRDEAFRTWRAATAA